MFCVGGNSNSRLLCRDMNLDLQTFDSRFVATVGSVVRDFERNLHRYTQLLRHFHGERRGNPATSIYCLQDRWIILMGTRNRNKLAIIVIKIVQLWIVWELFKVNFWTINRRNLDQVAPFRVCPIYLYPFVETEIAILNRARPDGSNCLRYSSIIRRSIIQR